MEDWLYTDGEDATATEFEERLDMLKAIGDPIFFRFVPSHFSKFEELLHVREVALTCYLL